MLEYLRNFLIIHLNLHMYVSVCLLICMYIYGMYFFKY